MSPGEEHMAVLLQQCREGNQKAQLRVYNKYYHAMYNAAWRVVKDAAAAEDIMQESFLSAFTHLHRFKGEVTFGAWLKKIVLNNSFQHYKTQKKRGEVPLEDILYKVEDETTTPRDQEATVRKARQVIKSLAQLKENYRIALTLHLIEGYDYEEVAGIMNLSYGNCRTTISRAKESLRKKIKMPH
ncbi:RNA polymerase sigma factor [Maribacter sp. 2307ULW6-5]|uniref:RNA polymerase sigma factor n=1 Tax=Maribacter sp. 2307ULW6-5 TaxID=3386275 RepID=UPI0039BC8F7A